MGMIQKWTPAVPLAPFAPDLMSLGSDATDTARNCVPTAQGWGPFKSLVDFTKALPSRCRGYFFARMSDGSIAVFAGTVSGLYKLNNNTFVWDDVSKGGVPYSDLVANDNWQFGQFNDFVIAVQVNTVPQKYVLTGGGLFVDLGGSPPQAGSIAIINRFVVLSNLLSNSRRVQWSDLGAPETWASGLADFEDLADGGVVAGVCGGDAFGYLFQDDTIRSLIYAPGSATTFEIRKIAVQETLFAKYGFMAAGSLVFYISAAGFKMIAPGSPPIPIGKELVDAFFFRDVDRGNLQLVIGASDPTQTRAYFAYKSGQGAFGLFDKLLFFDYALKRWGFALQTGEYLASLAKPGLTLDNLDALAPTPLNVLGAANNGAGLIRLTLNATFNADFNIAGQNFIVVYDVEGTVEANGTWAVNIIDATHIDLIGSAFVHAWTAGGHVGGSLDALPFSLDSISKAAVAELSAFSSVHKLGFFNGANMEAVMETAEQGAQGQVVEISGLRPVTDSPLAVCSIGQRMNLKKDTAIVYSDETTINEDGFCDQLVETRYSRGRIRVPAGDDWTYASGAEALIGPAGDA